MSRARILNLGALIAGVVCMAMAAPATAQQTGYSIVINAENPANTMRQDHIRRMFLGKVGSWSHGVKVLPVDRSTPSAVREQFSSEVLGKAPRAVKSYWQQQVFSGRGVPPVEMSSDAEVLSYVSRNAGAIGYVATDRVPKGVKILEVVR